MLSALPKDTSKLASFSSHYLFNAKRQARKLLRKAVTSKEAVYIQLTAKSSNF